ncbi:thioesterase domain-containing protein [Nucisporomicrobium flavum]|uniref:thioesterase domain-containing protein n=1 Tax=Nucisporomicrobium flavum TaxID=2785915 RepID=UPI0018F6F7BD|nr:thioesterase domain-containing protein [Nucisporomicrobium flavum]
MATAAPARCRGGPAGGTGSMGGEAQRAALTARLGVPRGGAVRAGGPVVSFGTTGRVSAFALPAVGGTVHEYAALARGLDGAVRLHGIEADGLYAGAAPPGSLDAVVARTVELVRRSQPDGPYRLIGWAGGGIVAYETARRLEAEGGTVAQVVLIDSPYRTDRWRPDPADDLAALFAGEVLRGLGRPAPVLPRLSAAQHLAVLADHLADRPAPPGTLLSDLERWYAVFVSRTAALSGYRAAGHLAAAALLVSAHGSQDWAPYWRGRFHGGVRELSTTAGHYGILHPPAVASTAAAIRAALS